MLHRRGTLHPGHAALGIHSQPSGNSVHHPDHRYFHTGSRKSHGGHFDREDQIAPVPMALRKQYLLRSKNKSKKEVRFILQIRSKVVFLRLNFMQNSYGLSETMDIISRRNVLIYFDIKTQEKVINSLCRHLSTGGFLFTGHSETLHNLDVPLVQTGSCIYRRI